MFFIHHYI